MGGRLFVAVFEQERIAVEEVGHLIGGVGFHGVLEIGHALLAVNSYRQGRAGQGKVLYFDEKSFRVVEKPVKA